jgi:hypothetical protein
MRITGTLFSNPPTGLGRAYINVVGDSLHNRRTLIMDLSDPVALCDLR